MTSKQPYTIHNDIKFPPLQLIDVGRLQKETKDQWFNQTLCEVNDSVVRVGVLKGVMHRTSAPERSVILMIERKGVVPTGD